MESPAIPSPLLVYIRQRVARPRSEAKRSHIVDTAMRHFAENGYHAARVGDIAATLGIAKGSIFQHFGSKDGLFFEVYKRAVRSFSEISGCAGRCARRRLLQCSSLLAGPHRASAARRLDPVSHCAARQLRHRPDVEARNQSLPHGRRSLRHCAFVRFGLERGELRKDMDVEMIVSILDWTIERFQDALLTAELDPGLFRKQGEMPEKKEARIQQFLAFCSGRWARILHLPLAAAMNCGSSQPPISSSGQRPANPIQALKTVNEAANYD